jgi:hypothetical protein
MQPGRALVNREHDGQHMREVGRGLEEDAALVERLAHELVLLIVELHDGLLEVTDAAVDELCRLGGRAWAGVERAEMGARDGARTGAEVLALDESDSESAGSSVKRDARAGRAAADDEQVELLIGAGRAQGVEHVLARRRRPWGRRPASLERGCGVYRSAA